MIGVDSPSPYDLRFPLGPIPVRVGLMFWVITGLFGYLNAPREGVIFINILIWVACVLVSILAHEMGHALAYRLFGSGASIALHGFGGHATATDPPRHPFKRMLVSLAGPAAGFLLYGIVIAVTFALANTTLHFYVRHAIDFMIWINLFWSLFNLLPILPLDGGNVCRELLATFRVRSADVIAAGVGFVLSLSLAIYGGLLYAGLLPAAVIEVVPWWIRPGWWMTFWFALFAVNNFQLMQLARRNNRYRYEPPDDDYDTPPWRRR